MENIIPGAALSTFVTSAISVGQSKRQNRDNKLSQFAVLTLRDKGSRGSSPARHVFFDEDLGEGTCAALMRYRKVNATGQPEMDSKGGYLIDLAQIRAIPDENDGEDLKGLLNWPGGMVMPYKLKKGPCYANDIDGNITVDGAGEKVVKDTIDVFVQVKYATSSPNGGLEYHYFSGLGIERGSRIENRFFKNAVDGYTGAVVQQIQNAAPAQPAAQPAANPFAQPAPAQQGAPAQQQPVQQQSVQTPF